MARGGGSNNNNGGNRSNNNNGGNGGNRFANLESNSQSTSDDSPFYLSNSDHPGLGLVSQPLIGNNYNSWSRSMTMALIAKNKLCFVDGTISKLSPDDDYYNSWSHCNSMVMSWILHAVSREIADSIMYIDNAESMPIPSCNCGGMKALMDYQQQEYVLQFLMGLNESFAQIRAQILMQDPLPPINKILGQFLLVIVQGLFR
ncbi:hypothetical protein UlMin_026660 [Ulmus minor]